MLTRVPIVAVLLLAVLALVGGTAEAQQYQMKLQSLLNPGHMAADAEVWFAQEVEKRSNGRIKITFYPAASLGFGGARIMTVVKDGLLLKEIAPDTSVEAVVKATGAALIVPANVGRMAV